jgi:hypothetical protein
LGFFGFSGFSGFGFSGFGRTGLGPCLLGCSFLTLPGLVGFGAAAGSGLTAG